MTLLNDVDRVTPDLIRPRNPIVNRQLRGTPEHWVLIDSGLPGSMEAIVGAGWE